MQAHEGVLGLAARLDGRGALPARVLVVRREQRRRLVPAALAHLSVFACIHWPYITCLQTLDRACMRAYGTSKISNGMPMA